MKLIRDNLGRLIGQINESGDVVYLRDEHGHLKGTYIKSADKTYNGHGQYFGPGDQLLRCLDK